ncbi:MAG: hypothetical protein ABIA04_12440 [Pseudomonadota bacterium]
MFRKIISFLFIITIIVFNSCAMFENNIGAGNDMGFSYDPDAIEPSTDSFDSMIPVDLSDFDYTNTEDSQDLSGAFLKYAYEASVDRQESSNASADEFSRPGCEAFIHKQEVILASKEHQNARCPIEALNKYGYLDVGDAEFNYYKIFVEGMLEELEAELMKIGFIVQSKSKDKQASTYYLKDYPDGQEQRDIEEGWDAGSNDQKAGSDKEKPGLGGVKPPLNGEKPIIDEEFADKGNIEDKSEKDKDNNKSGGISAPGFGSALIVRIGNFDSELKFDSCRGKDNFIKDFQNYQLEKNGLYYDFTVEAVHIETTKIRDIKTKQILSASGIEKFDLEGNIYMSDTGLIEVDSLFYNTFGQGSVYFKSDASLASNLLSSIFLGKQYIDDGEEIEFVNQSMAYFDGISQAGVAITTFAGETKAIPLAQLLPKPNQSQDLKDDLDKDGSDKSKYIKSEVEISFDTVKGPNDSINEFIAGLGIDLESLDLKELGSLGLCLVRDKSGEITYELSEDGTCIEDFTDQSIFYIAEKDDETSAINLPEFYELDNDYNSFKKALPEFRKKDYSDLNVKDQIKPLRTDWECQKPSQGWTLIDLTEIVAADSDVRKEIVACYSSLYEIIQERIIISPDYCHRDESEKALDKELEQKEGSKDKKAEGEGSDKKPKHEPGTMPQECSEAGIEEGHFKNCYDFLNK